MSSHTTAIGYSMVVGSLDETHLLRQQGVRLDAAGFRPITLVTKPMPQNHEGAPVGSLSTVVMDRSVKKTTGLPHAGTGLDWEALYEQHAEELARFMTKLLGDRERAADMVHDTFVRAIRSADQLRDTRSVRPWLFKIAAGLAQNERRRRALIAFLPFRGHERGAPDAFDTEAAQIHQALRSIPTDQAIALFLHYQSGFSRLEVAALTGVSEEGVKSRLARGRLNFIAAYRRLERGLAR
jgi:RNA polymerase sigma-70 factor, ECF subfamily